MKKKESSPIFKIKQFPDFQKMNLIHFYSSIDKNKVI